MKKLLSVVLVLAMLASMCIYLPMGVTAAETRANNHLCREFRRQRRHLYPWYAGYQTWLDTASR